MRHEYRTLLCRKLRDRVSQLFQQHALQILLFRPTLARRQQFLYRQALAVFVHLFGKRLRPALAKQVGDPVPRHAIQPPGHVINRHQQPVRFHQPVENVLENVFGLFAVRHLPANEVAQPRPLLGKDLRDVPVLLAHRNRARRFRHTPEDAQVAQIL